MSPAESEVNFKIATTMSDKENQNLFAVITGDIAGSSRLQGEQRIKLLNNLKRSFGNVEKLLGKSVMAYPFEIFRGDSFQGVLKVPESALKASVIIRATIRSSFKTTLKNAFDARIAVGIGSISLFPDKSSGEGDGEAYRNSGPELDMMEKKNRLLVVKTPWEEVNRELNVECALLDVIISRWSIEQAEVLLMHFEGLTQQQIAENLNISQPGVRKRIEKANIDEIEMTLTRFEQLIHQKYNPVGL